MAEISSWKRQSDGVQSASHVSPGKAKRRVMARYCEGETDRFQGRIRIVRPGLKRGAGLCRFSVEHSQAENRACSAPGSDLTHWANGQYT